MTKNFVIWYAEHKHKGQFRNETKEPYITHPLGVANILRQVTNNKTILTASILHDVIEDTDTSYAEIIELFGKPVADLVLDVTRNKKGVVPLETKEGLIIKLADTLHNLSDKPTQKFIEKKRQWVHEIMRDKKKAKYMKLSKEEIEDLRDMTEVEAIHK